jgi:hypothetical protein
VSAQHRAPDGSDSHVILPGACRVSGGAFAKPTPVANMLLVASPGARALRHLQNARLPGLHARRLDQVLTRGWFEAARLHSIGPGKGRTRSS